jgi:hypothetical protein
LDHEIYNSLPTYHRRLVDEIEQAFGLRIDVLATREALRSREVAVVAEFTDSCPGSVACFDKAWILYPGEVNRLTDDEYLHELLHLHGYLVLGIPHVAARDPRNAEFISILENQIQHIFIYADIFKNSSVAYQKFLEEMRVHWEAYPWTVRKQTAFKMQRLMIYWLVKTLANHPINRLAKGKLKADGVLFKTERAIEKLRRANGDKRKIGEIVTAYMAVEKNSTFLRTWLPREGGHRDQEI